MPRKCMPRKPPAVSLRAKQIIIDHQLLPAKRIAALLNAEGIDANEISVRTAKWRLGKAGEGIIKKGDAIHLESDEARKRKFLWEHRGLDNRSIARLLTNGGLPTSFDLIDMLRGKMIGEGIDLPARGEKPKKPIILSPEQEKLLKDLFPSLKQITESEAWSRKFPSADVDEFYSYVLEKIPAITANYKTPTVPYPAYVRKMIEHAADNFVLEQIRQKTGLRSPDAIKLMGLLGRLREGISLEKAAEELNLKPEAASELLEIHEASRKISLNPDLAEKRKLAKPLFRF